MAVYTYIADRTYLGFVVSFFVFRFPGSRFSVLCLYTIPVLLFPFRAPSPFQSGSGTMSSLCSLVRGLPDALQKQYNYEISYVTGGSQLLHSPFFQVQICNLLPSSLESVILHVYVCTGLAWE